MALSPSRFIAALGLSVSLATPLLAQSPTPAPTPAPAPVPAPSSQMRLSDVIAGLEDQGYRIREVDVGRDRIEVEALTLEGKEVDLEVSPVDGKIISINHEI